MLEVIHNYSEQWIFQTYQEPSQMTLSELTTKSMTSCKVNHNEETQEFSQSNC